MLFLPEVACTRGEEAESFCLDLMKLRHVDLSDNYYFELFSYANITITELYPKKEVFTLYERVPKNFSKSSPTFFVVTLKDEKEGYLGAPAYKYGFLKVEVFG